MGFRLSSFLAGVSEGAIEIDTAVRERNFDVIDRSLSRREDRLSQSLDERRDKQKQYEQLSALMDNYDLSDEQKYQVLKAGPEIAAKWLDTIPELAAKKGKSVADYIVMSDTDASGFTLSKALEEGRLPGMAVELEEFAPTGLRAGVFRSDYGEQARALAESQDREMGYQPTEESDMTMPEGKIDLMAMYEPERPTVGSFNPKQTYDQIGARIATALGVDFGRNDDGSINLQSDNEQKIKTARQFTNDAFTYYNDALRKKKFDVDYDQDLAIDYAVQEALAAEPVKIEADLLTNTETTDQPVVTEIEPEDLTTETATTPFELAQAIKNEAARQGKTLSDEEVRDMVKEELDRRKAESK